MLPISMVTTSLLGSIRAVGKIKLSSLHFGSTWLIYLYLFIWLYILKHANSSTIIIIIHWLKTVQYIITGTDQDDLYEAFQPH